MKPSNSPTQQPGQYFVWIVTDPAASLRYGETLDGEESKTREEFMQKISEEQGTYQKLLNPTPQ